MGDYGDAMMRNPNAAVQGRTKAQNRANVMQLKLIGQSHPTGLTANLLKLFEPRPPLEYKPPPEKRKSLPYTGMGQFVQKFAEPGDPEYAPPVQKGETPAARRARIHQIRLEEGARKAAEDLEKYDPANDALISGDPYKTLFVARLSFETTESKVKREFEAYGPIKRVRLVMDKESNKPRGYAFIEYLHTRDMKAAYKQADGKKIDNRRVIVDVERGRTVPNWRPRRLGGGLGTTRIGNEESNLKQLGSAPPGGASQPAEPRVERNREKSHEQGREREKEREKSRELSHDRSRDREHREDRHHRDRERNKEGDWEADRGRNSERDHDRDRPRHGRDRERERTRDHDKERRPDRHREKERKRGRDYEVADDRERGRSHDREYDYERERGDSKHDRSKRQRSYDMGEEEDDRGWAGHGHGHGHAEAEPDRDGGHYNYHAKQSRGAYNKLDDHGEYGGYREADRANEMVGEVEEDYSYDRGAAEPRDRDYRRSHGRDYEY